MKPLNCLGCSLYDAEGPTFAHGSGSNRVALVTDEPLSGRAVSVLDRVLRKVGGKDEFGHFSIVACSSNRGFLPPAIDHCGVHRNAALSRLRPQAVVALGEVAFKTLTGLEIPLSKARGYRFEGLDGIPVIPTYDPSYVGAGKMNLIPVLIWDILAALDERYRPRPEFPLEDLSLYPTPEEFSDYCDLAAHSEWVVLDLETPYTKGMDEEEVENLKGQIDRASLAFQSLDGKVKAITFPFQQPFIASFVKLMASGNEKVGWNNRDFDLLKLAEAGIYPAGRQVDVMWLWNFLRKTLPRGLGHVAPYYVRCPEWKSMGSKGVEEELYSAMDAWATAKIYLGLERVMRGRIL